MRHDSVMSEPVPSPSSPRTPLEAGKRDRRRIEITLAAKEVVGLGTTLKGEHKKEPLIAS